MIARNTAFTYKGKPFDVKTIARELNVRYVLEGSVQRGGARMRDRRAAHRRRDRQTFSGPSGSTSPSPILDMQDEIVARLAGPLNTELIAAEARRAEQAPVPDLDGPLFSGYGLALTRV